LGLDNFLEGFDLAHQVLAVLGGTFAGFGPAPLHFLAQLIFWPGGQR
jgi:hypothetical protein